MLVPSILVHSKAHISVQSLAHFLFRVIYVCYPSSELSFISCSESRSLFYSELSFISCKESNSSSCSGSSWISCSESSVFFCSDSCLPSYSEWRLRVELNFVFTVKLTFLSRVKLTVPSYSESTSLSCSPLSLCNFLFRVELTFMISVKLTFLFRVEHIFVLRVELTFLFTVEHNFLFKVELTFLFRVKLTFLMFQYVAFWKIATTLKWDVNGMYLCKRDAASYSKGGCKWVEIIQRGCQHPTSSKFTTDLQIECYILPKYHLHAI